MHRNPLVCLISCAVILADAGFAEKLPPLSESGYPLIDDVQYANDPAARAAWVANAGTEPVSVANANGRRVLQMPCRFKNTSARRAVWDRTVNLNLTEAAGVRFRLFCANLAPVSGFSFYFHSGDGWYAAKFEQAAPDRWTDVIIDKSDTHLEGRPAGWGKVGEIRIAAWRGEDSDTAFYIADLGLQGTAAPIAVIRAESAAPGEIASVIKYTQVITQHLRSLGVPYTMVADGDVSAAFLRNKKLVILPHNPDMAAPVVQKLAEFLRAGGKMISFYILPPELAAIVNIKTGKHVPQTYPGHFSSICACTDKIAGLPAAVSQVSWNILQAKPVEGRGFVAAYWHNEKGQNTGEPAIVVSDNGIHMTHVAISDGPAGKRALLMAMVGHFLPDLWQQSAREQIAQIDRIGSFAGPGRAEEFIRAQAPPDSPVPAMLQRASQRRESAESLLKAGKGVEAIQAALNARQEMIRAYCTVQKPAPGEHRAFWCHNAFGVEGMDWNQAVRILAENGFTAIFPNTTWAGTAYHRSRVLPVSSLVEKQGDQVSECAAACAKYGIECHVWKVCWNMAGRAPAAFASQMKQEGRTQVTLDGKPQDQWLCPSHPANQKLEIDSLLELVRNYNIRGIHMDYIRYPGSESCFCDGCRERFEKSAGVRVPDWPAGVRDNAAFQKKWLDFRRRNITRVVETVSQEARKIKPGIKISAAVFPNWPMDRDQVGQDWRLWCEKGYLDFVCPMDYTPDNARFEDTVRRQTAWAGKVPCYPGIGLSTWPEREDIGKLIDQINITRRLKTGGFTIFQYRDSEARETVPLCGLGITRKE